MSLARRSLQSQFAANALPLPSIYVRASELLVPGDDNRRCDYNPGGVAIDEARDRDAPRPWHRSIWLGSNRGYTKTSRGKLCGAFRHVLVFGDSNRRLEPLT
jgi:hypothetical protein